MNLLIPCCFEALGPGEILKADGMSQLRGAGVVGTWNPKDKKGGGRSMIKLQLGSTILDMERISVGGS